MRSGKDVTASRLFLTVEDAAEILGIGRTSAYKAARRYVATKAPDAIPAIRVGKQLRIPRALFEAWAGVALPPIEPVVIEAPRPAPKPRRNARRRTDAQTSLPFEA